VCASAPGCKSGPACESGPMRASGKIALRLRGLFLTAALVAVAACGGASDDALDVSIDESVFAEAPWEREFADSEFTSWFAGTIREFPSNPAADLSGLAPVAGALVELVAPGPRGRPPLRVIATAETDAEGRYRVGPGPAGLWLVRVSKEGFAAGLGGDAPLVVGSMSLNAGNALFGIRRGHAVSVRVDDADGNPVPGVRVRASTMAYHQEAETDDAGRAHFVAPVGSVDFVVTDPSRAGAALNATVTEAPSSPGQEFQLVAPRLAPVTGWVVSSESALPLAGAVVMSVARPEIRTRTGPDGRFELLLPRDGGIAAFGKGRGWV